jgi:hypothetical protein
LRQLVERLQVAHLQEVHQIAMMGLSPGARRMLGIPDDHYMGLIIGFGYPETPYARGVQKDRSSKIHRFTTDKR